MLRRLEYRDDRSNKFWEIEVKGVDINVKFGRIGTQGGATTNRFDSPASAQKEGEKLVASKLKKGYVEVGGARKPDGAGEPAPTGGSAASKAAAATKAAVMPKGAAAPEQAIVPKGAARPKQAAGPPAPVVFFIDRIDHKARGVPKVAAGAERAIHVAFADGEGVHLRSYDATWHEENIREGAAAHVQIAVDSKGRLFALYDVGGEDTHHQGTYKKAGVDLELAWREDGAWHRETVAQKLWDYCYARDAWALALDAQDSPHAAWVCKESAYYASREGGAWKVEKVGRAERGYEVALAVGPEGEPHLVYSNDSYLQHTWREGGKWLTERVGERYHDDYPAVAVDREGGVHVAYMGSMSSCDRLFYARRKDGNWMAEMVDRGGNNGWGNQLAVDGRGIPHVNYRSQKSRHSASSTALVAARHRYAVRRDGKWQVCDIAEGGWANAMVLVGDRPLVVFATALKGMAHAVGISMANTHAQLVSAEENAKPVEKTAGELASEVWRKRRVDYFERFRREKHAYLEHHSANGGKFWEITVDRKRYSIRFGKIGQQGQKKEKSFASEAAALTDAEARLDEKWGIYDEPAEGAKDQKEGEANLEAWKKAQAEQEEKERAEAAADPDQPLVWDLRDPQGPLLGRLRGVSARHELRDYDKTIYAKPERAHFALKRPIDDPWPDVLSNTEYLLVVSSPLRAALSEVDSSLTFWPLKLEDASGEPIAKEYFMALVLQNEQCIRAASDYDESGYQFRELKDLSYVSVEAPAPVYRARGTRLFVATPAAAATLEAARCRGVRFCRIADYSEPPQRSAEHSYQLLTAGGGAELELVAGAKDGEALGEVVESIQKGEPTLATFPPKVLAAMQPPRSRKRVLDVMTASHCLLVSKKVKEFFEAEGVTNVEYLPVKIKDHAGKVGSEEHYLVNVLETCDYVDLEESSVTWTHGLLWKVHDLVLDETLPRAKPPLFRLARARYAWLLVRNDLVEKLEALKVEGWRAWRLSRFEYAHNDVHHIF